MKSVLWFWIGLVVGIVTLDEGFGAEDSQNLLRIDEVRELKDEIFDIAGQIANDEVEFARFLKGNFALVQSILAVLDLNLPVTSLEGKITVPNAKCIEILGQPVQCITLYIFFPDPSGNVGLGSGNPVANCYNFGIEGDAFVTSYLKQNATRFFIPGTDSQQMQFQPLSFNTDKQTLVYSIILEAVRFECDLPIITITNLDESNPVEVDDVVGDYPVGNLNFDIGLVNLNISGELYAGDGQTGEDQTVTGADLFEFFEFNPDNGTILNWDYKKKSKCEPFGVDLQDITFTATDLDPVTVGDILPLPIIGDIEIEDLAQSLTEELNDVNSDNRGVALDPVAETLCGLVVDLNKAVLDLMLNGTFDEFAPQLFDPLTDIESIQLELALYPTPDDVLLVDIANNPLVDFVGLFPDDSGYIAGEDSPTGVSELVAFALGVNFTETKDPILDIIDELLNTTFAEDEGATNLDVLLLVEDFLGEDSPVVASEGVTVNFTLEIFEGRPAIDVAINLKNVLFTTEQRFDVPERERFFLDEIRATGNQTLKLPTVLLGNIFLEADFQVEVEFYGGSALVAEDADADDLFAQALGQLVAFQIPKERGTFSGKLGWYNFFAEASILLPINEIAVRNLPLGPIFDEPLNCLISTFYRTPTVSGLNTNADVIELDMSAPDSIDGLLNLVLDAAEFLLIPSLQGLIPNLVETFADSSLIDQQLIEPTVCPGVIDTGDILFNFTGELMDDIQELLDESLAETLVDTVFPKGVGASEDYNQIIPDPIEILYFEDLPSNDGLNITLEFLLSLIEVKGLSPANFTIFELLQVDPENLQTLNNELGIGTLEMPVDLGLIVELNTYPDSSLTGARRRMREVSDDESFSWDSAVNGNDQQRFLQVITSAPTSSLSPTFSPTPFPTPSPTTSNPSASPTTASPTTASPTAFPTPYAAGEQRNKIRLDVKFENVYGLLNLLLPLINTDVRSTTIENALSFSCWMGKLQPYGGPQNISVVFNEISMKVTCLECTNDVFKQLPFRFNNPQAGLEFFDLINEVLELGSEILLDFFNEENWNRTVTNFQLSCEGKDTIPQPVDTDEFKEDMSGTYAYLGGATIFLIAAGCSSCFCLRPPHKKHVEANQKRIEALQKNPLGFLEDTGNTDHEIAKLEDPALYNHPSVPVWCRFVVPSLILLNFVLFIIGHVFVAVSVSIEATVAGVDIVLDNFQSISVIESARALLESGGYFLAILIIALSIMWPYFKLLGMMVAWFIPTKFINIHTRGKIIKRLDQLGKWSLVELYFLLFVIISFDLGVSSPENTFLPEGFYVLQLLIIPEFSIYCFCTALVVSLATSNVQMVFHEKIERQIYAVTRTPQKADEFHIALGDFVFAVNGGTQTAKITFFGSVVLAVVLFISIILTFVFASLTAFTTEIVGLARLVLELEGKSNTADYSVFSFFGIIFARGESTLGTLYLGVFFGLTILIIPVLQSMLLMYMSLARFSLARAQKMYELNELLSAWCCIEVFILGVGVTVLEVGMISGGLIGDACEFLNPILENQLEPIGLLDERDVAASCARVNGILGIGMYVGLFVIILQNIAHFLITFAFNRFIDARIAFPQRPEPVRSRGAGLFLNFFLCTRCMSRQQDDEVQVAF